MKKLKALFTFLFFGATLIAQTVITHGTARRATVEHSGDTYRVEWRERFVKCDSHQSNDCVPTMKTVAVVVERVGGGFSHSTVRFCESTACRKEDPETFVRHALQQKGK